MAQVQFNKPATIGKATYGKGQHSVPDEDVKNDWYFSAMVKDGSVVVLRDAVEAPAAFDAVLILEASVKDVVASLEAFTAEQLQELATAEEAGKARKGVLDAIAAAVEAKAVV